MCSERGCSKSDWGKQSVRGEQGEVGGTCAREGVVVPVFLECRVPDSLILVCCGWEFLVLSVSCMLQSPSCSCWEYVSWGARSSPRASSAQAGARRGARQCWRERGEGVRGRAIIIQGGCSGRASEQSRPGWRGGQGEVGLAGEQGRATPVSRAGVAVPVF